MAHSGFFSLRHSEWGPIWYHSTNRSTTHTAPRTQHHARMVISQGFPFFGQLVLGLLLKMSLHLWVWIGALQPFLAPLARNPTDMVLKPRSALASSSPVALLSSVCLRSMPIFDHKIEVRSDIVNTYSSGAYDRR